MMIDIEYMIVWNDIHRVILAFTILKLFITVCAHYYSGYQENTMGELPGDLRDDAEECRTRVPVHDGRARHGGIYRR